MTTVLCKSLISNEDRVISQLMSTRLVNCASILENGSKLGWKMVVPKEGMVSISLFGTEEITINDLEWISEKVWFLSSNTRATREPAGLSELYEICLPVSKTHESNVGIGFGTPGGNPSDLFDSWPTYYSSQFEEWLRALQQTGAVFQAVVGPATRNEIEACRKSTLKSYNNRNTDVSTYIGNPVKARFLLKLPSKPSVRLKTVLKEAIPGAHLHHLGTMRDPRGKDIWDDPLNNATTLPEFAARILMMEPTLSESVVGIEVREVPTKPIPASHSNPNDAAAVTIGEATTTTGERIKIKIGDIDLKRHYQIVGQTGTGKSSLLAGLIRSAIETGHGLTFFDPHGSTVDIVLQSLPQKYAKRVRVVRLGDADNPVPLNIWDTGDPVKEERNISDLCELFADLFDPKKTGIVGPRYERWLSTFSKASLAFLGHRASLESILVLSQSRANMRLLYDAIRDEYPDLAMTIEQEYGKDNSSDFHNTLNFYLAKFQRVTSVEQLRKTLGAGTNALDFVHSIDTPMVTLIDLSSPVIGSHAARIVGTLMLMKLWNAAMEREHREMNHLVVVDEASLFQTNPMPRMLAEGRKFGVSMVLYHQHAGQLTTEIIEALEANSANFSAFRLSPRDATTAAVRLNNAEYQTLLPRLDAFKAITTLSVDGIQTAPFTLEIPKPKRLKNGEEIAVAIEKHSVDTLVEPNRYNRALTRQEIQDLLYKTNTPEWIRQDNSVPEWKKYDLYPSPWHQWQDKLRIEGISFERPEEELDFLIKLEDEFVKRYEELLKGKLNISDISVFDEKPREEKRTILNELFPDITSVLSDLETQILLEALVNKRKIPGLKGND